MIKSANLDGSNVRRVLQNARQVGRSFGFVMFEDDVYWTDRDSGSIKKINKFTGDRFQIVVAKIDNLFGMDIYDGVMQQQGKKNNKVCKS